MSTTTTQQQQPSSLPITSITPTPFTISIPDDAIEDLQRRLNSTRMPNFMHSTDHKYGISSSLQTALLQHWKESYDWKKHQDELNSFKHFKLNVNGLSIHFIHERSRVPGAIPLLLVHGWPGSVWEFHNVIPKLVNPEGRALRLKQAFHVIVPSLPGYGWSETRPGINTRKTGQIFDELMRRLGYGRYFAQGGDWGGIIVKQMAFDHPNSCVGIHLNMAMPTPPFSEKVMTLRGLTRIVQSAIDMSPLGGITLSERDRHALQRTREYVTDDSAYFHIQASKPQTLGFGLTDSPAGLLAWIGEKMQSWTDGKGNVLNVLSKDDILTNVSIYWFTNTIASSVRMYYESIPVPKSKNVPDDMASTNYVQVPTGWASFPQEILAFPKSWVALSFNLVHYTEFADGGHFAAWEQPELFVQDLRTFAFRSVTFEKCCRLADERKLIADEVKNQSGETLATKMLFLSPVLPTPVVAGVVAYLLASKL
jgi:pimeloyl-ACP methyl ester carboxylesterase